MHRVLSYFSSSEPSSTPSKLDERDYEASSTGQTESANSEGSVVTQTNDTTLRYLQYAELMEAYMVTERYYKGGDPVRAKEMETLAPKIDDPHAKELVVKLAGLMKTAYRTKGEKKQFETWQRELEPYVNEAAALVTPSTDW
jgi:hypothetical protein